MAIDGLGCRGGLIGFRRRRAWSGAGSGIFNDIKSFASGDFLRFLSLFPPLFPFCGVCCCSL